MQARLDSIQNRTQVLDAIEAGDLSPLMAARTIAGMRRASRAFDTDDFDNTDQITKELTFHANSEGG